MLMWPRSTRASVAYPGRPWVARRAPAKAPRPANRVLASPPEPANEGTACSLRRPERVGARPAARMHSARAVHSHPLGAPGLPAPDQLLVCTVDSALDL